MIGTAARPSLRVGSGTPPSSVAAALGIRVVVFEVIAIRRWRCADDRLLRGRLAACDDGLGSMPVSLCVSNAGGRCPGNLFEEGLALLALLGGLAECLPGGGSTVEKPHVLQG